MLSFGLEMPFIHTGDNLIQMILDRLDEEEKSGEIKLQDKDVIGVTESVVARVYGQYITIDDIAESIEEIFNGAQSITLVNPIYSRNRFSMILRGIARAVEKIILIMPSFDEVGNPSGTNPFTGVNILDYYRQICEEENCKCTFHAYRFNKNEVALCYDNVLYCGVHDYEEWDHSLVDVCNKYNPDFGVLGTNKADGERLKLFPTRALATSFCYDLKRAIKQKYNVDVIVCVYGDGCFKDPVGGIWEFADPVTMPGFTDSELILSSPKEVKIKYAIDQGLSDDNIYQTIWHFKKDMDKDSMLFQGTTPRIYRDLLASLMDLTSGSGDRCTPVVIIQNYF